MEFCEKWISKLDTDPDLAMHVVWSDESIFKLNGTVNRHNSVYWASENPNLRYEAEMNAPGVCVWAGIWYGGIIGPFFFDGTVTAVSYLNMLENQAFPQIMGLHEYHQLWFQQDGAPAHYAGIVRTWLQEHFPGHVMGRRGDIDWPPRSCDLTPPDFFLWGYIKEKVYSEKQLSLNQLRASIQEHFQNIPPDMCAAVCESVHGRLLKCVELAGAQVI